METTIKVLKWILGEVVGMLKDTMPVSGGQVVIAQSGIRKTELLSFLLSTTQLQAAHFLGKIPEIYHTLFSSNTVLVLVVHLFH